MAAVNRTRYDSAQTVSDEHGKGAEVLRQQVASVYDNSSPSSSVSTNMHVMYCEVDMIIRYLRTMTVDVPDANADLTVYRNSAGTITALAAARAVDGLTTEVVTEETLTLAANGLRQDDTVYAIMVRDSGSTESGDWGVYLGWMPDIFSGDSSFRSF